MNNLYANTSAPFVSAMVLGLLTAISPCPMATNITAIGFIGKDIENKNRIFFNGLIYTLGRTFAYTALAVIIYLGADQFKISGAFQLYGAKIIGPLLLIIGVFMLGIIRINFPAFNRITEGFRKRKKFSFLDVYVHVPGGNEIPEPDPHLVELDVSTHLSISSIGINLVMDVFADIARATFLVVRHHCRKKIAPGSPRRLFSTPISFVSAYAFTNLFLYSVRTSAYHWGSAGHGLRLARESPG